MCPFFFLPLTFEVTLCPLTTLSAKKKGTGWPKHVDGFLQCVGHDLVMHVRQLFIHLSSSRLADPDRKQCTKLRLNDELSNLW